MKANIKIICFFCIMCLLSCAIGKDTYIDKIITIAGDEKTIIEGDSLFSRIDTILLRPNNTEYIGQVQDVSFTDSMVYILDKTNTIWVFNLETGAQEKKVNKSGRGNGEYINLSSICVENDSVYVLDFQGLSIGIYDLDLHFKRRINLTFPSIDFAKTSDGFLLYNMNPSEQLKRIVHIDTNGKILNSFLSTEMDEMVMMTDRIFSTDDERNVFFSEPASSIVYKWDNGMVKPEYTFKYKKETFLENSQKKSNSNPQTIRSFVASHYVISLYLLHKFVLVSLYNQENAISKSGMIDTHLHYPFFPIVYSNKSLWGIYDSHSIADNKNGFGMVLVKYQIKQ